MDHKKQYIWRIALKGGLGQFTGGLAKIGRRVFLRGGWGSGWYIDGHYDLILGTCRNLRSDLLMWALWILINVSCNLMQRKKQINAKKSSRFELKCWIIKTVSLNSQFIAIIMLTSQWRFWVKVILLRCKIHSVRYTYLFNINLSKTKCKTWMNTEPTHFLTLMNNSKAFFSLDVMACSYQCTD